MSTSAKNRYNTIVRLTYASQLTASVDAQAIKKILEQAQGNNIQNGITGMLCFNRKYFLQTIEGSRASINHLYKILLEDDRHTNVQLFSLNEVEARNWTSWAMGYATPTNENRLIFLKYCPTVEFNPYTLTAETAAMLLEELANQIPTK